MMRRTLRFQNALLSVAFKRRSFSVWDRVHPSIWHPMATLEQSLMEFDRFAERIISRESQRAKISKLESDEFFENFFDATEEKRRNDEKYSCYSYMSASVVDESGQRISSIRRRYEDSNGRLKAVHERSIGDKMVKSVWMKKEKSDPGEQHATLSEAEMDAFEKAWKETLFGKAEREKRLVKKGDDDEKMEPLKDDIGHDREAVDRAPKKEMNTEGEGLTDDAKRRTREDAISRGSLNQESETTPVRYTS